MTPFYPNLCRWILPLCLIPCCLDATAQQSVPPADVSRQTSFITHAPVLFPSLLKEQQFTTMKNFLFNWRNSGYPSQELIFAAEALLAIETDTFESYLLPCDCLSYLAAYARDLRHYDARGSNFRYYLPLDPPYRYDATIEAGDFIFFLRNWAYKLLQRPGLDEDELFICHIVTGDFRHPRVLVRFDPDSCPRIAYTQYIVH